MAVSLEMAEEKPEDLWQTNAGWWREGRKEGGAVVRGAVERGAVVRGMFGSRLPSA